MNIVKLEDILISSNRQRRELHPEQIVDLSRSIQNNGILHPPVVRKTPEGTIQLVAGERRLLAMRMLIELEVPIRYAGVAYLQGTVPVSFLSELSEEKAFEAELEENIIRVDLTWQERSLATAHLHKLRTIQASERGEAQTLKDTVKEIKGGEANNWDYSASRADVILATHLHDPEVYKAPTKKEALKVVDKKAKSAHRAKLAETFDLSQSPHIIVQGSSLEYMKTMESESMDCLLTDPPYGISATEFGSNFATTHDYEDSWETFLVIAEGLARESFRILRPNTHAYVFCSYDGFAVLRSEFQAAGFKVWPQPMIWSKGNGNAPWVQRGHKKTYECIMFASKGLREMTTVKTDVLSYGIVADRDHGAEKPVELFIDLLQRSISPGETVFDPFCGSGTIFPAADACFCTALGIELSKQHYNTALTRLTKAAAL